MGFGSTPVGALLLAPLEIIKMATTGLNSMCDRRIYLTFFWSNLWVLITREGAWQCAPTFFLFYGIIG